MKSIEKADCNREIQEDIKKWCKDIVVRRIVSIVSNQHWGAYDRAALILCACAEMIANSEDSNEAFVFINSVKNRFPRHRSFIADVDKYVKASRFKLY